jgi:hypothetical protein
MLFWILLAVVIFVGVLIGIAASRDEYMGDIGFGIFAWFFSTAIMVMVVLFGLGIYTQSTINNQPYTTTSTSHVLKNLGDNSTVTGRLHGSLFGSYGYIDGKRVLAFAEETDGYAVLGQVDADDVRIHEGAAHPHFIRHDYVWANRGLVPWDLGTAVDYDFYVPSGTISDQYTISNGGN